MRKLYAICAVALVVISSMVVLLVNETTDATPASYSFTYGDYTVTQSSASVENNVVTAEYALSGGDVSCSYRITYGIQEGILTASVTDERITKLGDDALEVLIIPPKVVISEGVEYSLGGLEGRTTTTNQLVETKVLIISTEGGRLTTIGGQSQNNIIRGLSALETLVIDAAFSSTGMNTIRDCACLSEVYIREMGTHSNRLWSLGNSATSFNLSFKTTSSTSTYALVTGAANVKLLSGSIKAEKLDFSNVSKVLLDSADWSSTVTLNDLANEVTTGNAEIEFYGSSQSTSYTVAIAQNQTGVSVSTDSASENDVVTITLTPGQGKQVGEVSVVKEDNGVVQTTVDAQNPNVYTFVMPASNVIVSATFEDIPVAAVTIVPTNNTVAKGASTIVTISAVGLTDVSSLYITLTYDDTKFNLKSPAYSDMLDSAVLKGDLTKGEYVVAFATPQDISGDLLTFQLEAKDDAPVGSYTIGCTVEINGAASGNTNTPGGTYSNTSTLSIGNLLGDLDSDGDVDEDDAVYLLLYTFRTSNYPIPGGQNVDYNNDGVINSDDAIYLKNYVVNPTQYPIGGA